MKKIMALLLILWLLPGRAGAEAEICPAREYAFSGKLKRTYDSETLKYTVETFTMGGALCYLSKIWMADPGKQIRKASSEWKKNLMRPIHLAAKIPQAALVINGSGFVSPVYPGIPENYPGTSPDYYYTPLGSLTVTDGEVYRSLTEVPFTGLTLEEDGLHMYAGVSTETVLAAHPLQTWCFYDECPLIEEDRIIMPEDWTFAAKKARRTVIGRADRNNYLILTVSAEKGIGLTLHRVNRFLTERFDLEWAFNLDGGSSSALLCRAYGKKKMETVTGGSARDADIMAFIELGAE